MIKKIIKLELIKNYNIKNKMKNLYQKLSQAKIIDTKKALSPTFAEKYIPQKYFVALIMSTSGN